MESVVNSGVDLNEIICAILTLKILLFDKCNFS